MWNGMRGRMVRWTIVVLAVGLGACRVQAQAKPDGPKAKPAQSKAVEPQAPAPKAAAAEPKTVEVREIPESMTAAAAATTSTLAAAPPVQPAPPAAAEQTSVPDTAAPAPVGQASPEVKALLERIAKANGNVKTLTVEFDQVKRWAELGADSGEEVTSSGKVYLQLPGKMRCEYSRPDPSVLLFAGKEFYHYVDNLAQVDKYVYASEEEASERFRMMMLGFGVSGEQVLSSYNVTQEPADPKVPGTVKLAFRPVHSEIRKVIERIFVWFDAEKNQPRKVEVDEVSKDVTEVTIRPGKFLVNPEIDKKMFEANWPKKNKNGNSVQVIDHSTD